MKYIKLNHAVVGATWNGDEGLWHVRVRTPEGTEIEDTCNILINGGGILKYVALYKPCLRSGPVSVLIRSTLLLVTGSGQTWKASIPSRGSSNTAHIMTNPSISPENGSRSSALAAVGFSVSRPSRPWSKSFIRGCAHQHGSLPGLPSDSLARMAQTLSVSKSLRVLFQYTTFRTDLCG
jgi:hypothetical protein